MRKSRFTEEQIIGVTPPKIDELRGEAVTLVQQADTENDSGDEKLARRLLKKAGIGLKRAGRSVVRLRNRGELTAECANVLRQSLRTDRLRMQCLVRPNTRCAAAPPVARRASLHAAGAGRHRGHQPALREEPRAPRAPSLRAGADAACGGHGAVSRGAKALLRGLPRRAPADAQARRLGALHRLLPLRHPLPGALHPHRGGRAPGSRGGEVSRASRELAGLSQPLDRSLVAGVQVASADQGQKGSRPASEASAARARSTRRRGDATAAVSWS